MTLFNLIHSLTRTEKAYFKKTWSAFNPEDKKNNYVRLFDAINRQKEYNEEELKQKMAKAGIGKNFRHVKHYLYEQILKSLQDYHADNSNYMKLSNTLQQIKILHDKGFYRQCYKLIKKGKTIAMELEYFPQYIDLLSWEITLMYKASDYSPRERLMKEYDKTISDMIEYRKYLDICAKVFQKHYTYFTLRDKDQILKMKKLTKSPELSKKTSDLNTYRSKETYLRSYSTFYRTIGDQEKSYHSKLSLTKLMEKHPQFIEEEKSHYVFAILNLLSAQLATRRINEAQAYIKKADNVLKEMPKNTNNYYYMTLGTLSNKARLFMCQGQTDGYDTFLTEFESTLEEGLKSENSRRLLVVSNLIPVCFFYAENYRKALFWSNKIIDSDLPEATRSFTYIFSLFIHYELNSGESLTYFIKNTKRYLKKHNTLYNLETKILKMFRDLLKASGKEEKKAIYTDFADNIDDNFSGYNFEENYETFNIKAWAISKANNTPFSEELKKMYMKQK